jgi:hypothetical protein
MFLSMSVPALAENKILLADFVNQGLEGWEEQSFVDNTRYEVTDKGLLATAYSVASGLAKELEIDFKQYPMLSWRWQKLQGFENANEREKQGDDFLARVYVVDKHFVPWKSRTLVYAWSDTLEKETVYDNPFTAQAVMWIVNDGSDPAGEWIEVNRNLRADWKAAFGDEPKALEVLAIMTDTDNSESSAQALYGEIWLSK